MLVGAFEGIFYLLERKRFDILFNQIVELLGDVFVNFAIFSLLIQELDVRQICRVV